MEPEEIEYEEMEPVSDIHSKSTAKYIENIRKIVSWFTEQLNQNNNKKDFYCEPIQLNNLEVNPYKRKLIEGIGIEFYYGFPFMLWTKFGTVRLHGNNHYYNCVGNEIRNSIVNNLIQKFDCKILVEKSINFDGEFGPVYQVGNVEDSDIQDVKYDWDFNYVYDKNQVNKIRQMISLT